MVGNVHEKQASVGSPRVGLNWHTDHYHLPEPGLFTYLHAIQVPADQGDTRYANGIAAYEALSPEMRARDRRHEGAAQPRAAVPQSLPRGERRRDGSRAAQDSRRRPSAGPHASRAESVAASIWAANGARASTAWSRTRRRNSMTTLLQHMIQDRFSYQPPLAAGRRADVRQSMQPAPRQRMGRSEPHSPAAPHHHDRRPGALLRPSPEKRDISGRLQNRDSLVWSAASRPGMAVLSS